MSQRIVWVCDGCGRDDGGSAQEEAHKHWIVAPSIMVYDASGRCQFISLHACSLACAEVCAAQLRDRIERGGSLEMS